MKNSVSDHSFYIDSEEEDEEKAYENNEGENVGGHEHDSDSDCSVDNRKQSKVSSYNAQWPQSYRFVFIFLQLIYVKSLILVLFH